MVSESPQNEAARLREELKRGDAETAQARRDIAEAMAALKKLEGEDTEIEQTPTPESVGKEVAEASLPETPESPKSEETKDAPSSPNKTLLDAEKRKKKDEEAAYKENEKREKGENKQRIKSEKEARKKEEKASKEKPSLTPEQTVAKFIADLKIEDILTPEFKSLSTEQKLLVVHNLQNRVVDIVKADAQTQYSEDIKSKPFFKKIWAGIAKQGTIKNLEAQTFSKIGESEDGKKLIANDLTQLTEMASERLVQINSTGNPEIVFLPILESDLESDKEAINRFNTAANKFREIPYEWGQEKSGVGIKIKETRIGVTHKKEYEEAKRAYEEARKEVLKIEESHVGREKAMTNMLQLDSVVQMEQLINTHPQAEQEFKRIAETAGGKELAKTVWNTLQSVSGGKNWLNKGLFVGGFGLRAATASMGLATGITAPITGAILGGVRGRVRAKQTLEERKREARHGKKDESKEKVLTTDTVRLAERLQKLVDEINNTTNGEEKAKKLSMLATRIEHTQGKIEKGLVNFGDAKSSLTNQFNLVNSLNSALVLRETLGSGSQELKTRIDRLLKDTASFAAEKTSKAQQEFLYAQMKRGAIYGAGFATAGYTVRYLGEHLGLWGHHIAENTVSRPTEHPIGKFPGMEKADGAAVAIDKSNIGPFPEGLGGTHQNTLADAIQKLNSPGDKIDMAHATPLDPFGLHHGEVIPQHAPGIPMTTTSSPEAAHTANLNAWEIVHKGQGVEHALIRDIEHNPKLAQELGFKGDISDAKALHEFAGKAAHRIALQTGYVDGAGHEVRITQADKVGYEIKMENGHAVVIEKTVDGKALGEFNQGHEFGTNPQNSYEKIVDTTHHESVARIMDSHEATVKADILEKMNADTHLTPQVINTQPVPPIEGVKTLSPEHVLGNTADQSAAINHAPLIHHSGVYNQYNLPGETMAKIDTIYQHNLAHIFPNNKDAWASLSKDSADKYMAMKDNTGEEGIPPFVAFMHKLQDVVGNIISDCPPPRAETMIERAETNKEYIQRVLEYITAKKPDKLAEVTLN